jgi:peptidoglycan/xylan/chitin deacetylase (PgdA/CDA1 family)
LGKFYFTCSFDDGDIADLRLAELLSKYNLKGTFYIPQSCETVSKSLNESQIKNLSELVEIGGHTISHQVLTLTTKEKARLEIINCKSWLENVTGKPVHSFCPPTGRFNSHHISFQQEAGFKSMRTIEMLSYSFQQIKSIGEFVILPTTTQVYHHTKKAYLNNSIKRLNFRSFPLFSRLFNLDWEEMSYNYISHLNENYGSRNIDYFLHLWGHSWEIEKYSLWTSLERILKKLSEIKGIIPCDNTELSEIFKSIKSEI